MNKLFGFWNLIHLLLFLYIRSQFIVNVYKQKNKEIIDWETFMESIEEEEGFGKGSTITSVKLKDVQDAYLDKSRRSLIH